MKILIVDDSATMRKIVMRALRQAGFAGHEIEEAANGKEALEQVGKARPDLILSDWNMPEMNGLELLEALNEAELTTRFCFITSEATSEMRGRAAEAGAHTLITKPFTAEVLQRSLGDLLG